MKPFKGNKKNLAILIASVLGFVLLLSLIIALFVKLDRQTTTQEIGREAYSIGLLNEDGSEKDGKTAIRTGFITVDGLACDLQDKADITYELYFYDGDEKFISASGSQAVDWSGSVPGNAKYVRIVITPKADEEVTLLEVRGYMEQLTVRVNR